MSQQPTQSRGPSADGVLVEVKDLETYFRVGTRGFLFGVGALHQTVRAVDGVNLSIRNGETLGLVGESGCGKSTLGYTILQLERATAGNVYYDGQSLTDLDGKQLRPFRRRMQIR
jgi:ABC-type oligopeptide transport system ATPase subunit